MLELPATGINVAESVWVVQQKNLEQLFYKKNFRPKKNDGFFGGFDKMTPKP